MSINLNQLVQGALTESVLQQLAGRVGCTPDLAQRVVSLCGPALIGSMMNKASSLDGARSLFAAIMAPSTNAHIEQELPHFVVHDEGFKTLIETSEQADGALTSRDSLNLLSDRIAEHTGVATSATRTIAGVVGATALGVLKRYFTQHNGSIGQLPTLLGHQLPVVRANMTDSFANALGLGSVGAFLAGVASRLKAVSSHLEHPATQHAAAFPLQVDTPPPAEQPAAEDKHHRKTWMWVAGAAALALFAALAARGCSTEMAHQDGAADAKADATDAKAEASASDASVASMPAVTAVTGNAAAASIPSIAPGKASVTTVTVDASGVPTFKATVNSNAERQRLIDTLSARLGAEKFHADIAVDPDTKPASWLDKLDALMPVFTQPGAQVSIVGEKVELSGSAADSKFDWLGKLKALFGTGWTVDAKDAQTVAAASDAQPVAASDTSARSECEPANLVRKLNLKPVNFRFGVNTLPKASLNELARSAKALKACAGSAEPIKLRIAGYSDNTGSRAINLQLSKQRAEAVRAYLIKHGVPASALSTEGFGEADPIADNKTVAGRMANRRAEFKLVK